VNFTFIDSGRTGGGKEKLPQSRSARYNRRFVLDQTSIADPSSRVCVTLSVCFLTTLLQLDWHSFLAVLLMCYATSAADMDAVWNWLRLRPRP
jgi:hypothetical protein